MLLRHIRYFLAVAEHANFTRAAEALHVSQPTLSQQIRQLEDTLDVQLLDRSGRAVRLTEAGEAYMQYARLALQNLEAGRRALHDVHALTRGSLRLAMAPTFTTYLIGPLVDAFNARYPAITLRIEEMPQERMEVLLSDDALDLGIAFDDVRSPDIERQVMFEESLALVVGEAHPLAGRAAPLASAAFEALQLVLLNESFATRRHVDRYWAAHGISPRIAVETNSVGAAVEIVRRGRLATLLPMAVTQGHGDLVPIKLRPAMPSRAIALLQRRDAYRSAAARAFAAMALEGRWHGLPGGRKK